MTPVMVTSFRAGVMPLVLGISVIMASICASLILYTYYGQSLYRSVDTRWQLWQNADSGISYLMASSEEPGDQFEMELFGEPTDSVLLWKKAWGMYDILQSEAHRGRRRVRKLVMVGNTLDSVHQSSLYLTESRSPLYLAGDASLTGTVYLPSSGVRTGSVGGTGYNGGKLIDGSKRRSGAMPELRRGITARLQTYLRLTESEDGHWNNISDLPDSMSYSFGSTRPVLYSSEGKVTIQQNLTGMIVVCSERMIRVEQEAVLRGVILVAPIIEVAPKFKGEFQAIAIDKIDIGDSAMLQYPSSLILLPRGDESRIELGMAAVVQGDILIDKDLNSAREGLLNMRMKSKLEGFAHIEGSVQILGSVLGHLSCRKFFLNYGTEAFGNHIKDAKFDYSKKAPWLTASGLWLGSGTVVIKDLD